MNESRTERKRELARREAAGIHVGLYWDDETDALTVLVLDTQTDTLLELPARREQALDVFRHPFAYADRAGRSLRVRALVATGAEAA